LSFDDQGGRPRTPKAPRPRSAASGRTPGVDDRTLLVRRAVAGVGGLVLVLLVGLVVRSYLNGKRDAALRSYNQKVATIASDEAQISGPLFKILTDAASTGQPRVGDDVNSYRVQAQLEASNARGLSVPSQMAGAQQNLLLALNLRAEALAAIANNVPSALGTDSAAQAITTITAEMQAFLASDVIYAERVAPLISQTLAAQQITDQTVSTSRFLPDLGWLSPQTVTQRMLGNSGGTTATGAPKPGTHGHGLLYLAVGATTLPANSTSVNQIKLTPAPTFTLDVANQGENDETGVVVQLKIEGAPGSKALVASKTINTKSMTDTKVMMGLTGTPPVGVTVKLVAEVKPVGGEMDKTNNTQTYLATFSR
jgi:hypothetical protein